jgi:hypothetical protein
VLSTPDAGQAGMRDTIDARAISGRTLNPIK